MAWVPVEFKGKSVWAECDDAGAPIVNGAVRQVRYSSAAGAKLYTAGASGIGAPTGPVVQLAEGTVQDAAAKPASKGSGFGKAGTRTAAQGAAAATDARSRIAAMGSDVILAFTDGACHGNPGPAGSGCVVKLPGQVVERHRALGEGTNNIAELVAIGMALEVLREHGLPSSTKIAIFSDSSYARGVLTQGWKAKANVVLIRKLKESMAEWPHAELHWVAGHVGIVENERADALAQKGVFESR